MAIEMPPIFISSFQYASRSWRLIAIVLFGLRVRCHLVHFLVRFSYCISNFLHNEGYCLNYQHNIISINKFLWDCDIGDSIEPWKRPFWGTCIFWLCYLEIRFTRIFYWTINFLLSKAYLYIQKLCQLKHQGPLLLYIIIKRID